MKYAIVDLGSNTIRLSVYGCGTDGNWRLLFSEKETAGLNTYVVEGSLSGAGIRRACAALERLRGIWDQVGVDQVRVFATASLRNIRNTRQAREEILASTGLPVEVISGELEGELGCRGVIRERNLENGMVFDIGGGSTEISRVQGGQILSAQSLPVGCLELFNRHVKKLWPKDKELEAIRREAEAALKGVPLPQPPAPLVCGVGGTARGVLKITNRLLDRPETERSVSMAEFAGVARCLLARKAEARDVILKACPDRLHTILPGVVLMEAVCRKLGCQRLYISACGVREGYLYRCLLSEKEAPLG